MAVMGTEGIKEISLCLSERKEIEKKTVVWDERNKIKKKERRRQWFGMRETRSRRKREEEIPVEKP